MDAQDEKAYYKAEIERLKAAKAERDPMHRETAAAAMARIEAAEDAAAEDAAEEAKEDAEEAEEAAEDIAPLAEEETAPTPAAEPTPPPEPQQPMVTREALAHILKKMSLDYVALPPTWQKKTKMDFEDIGSTLDPQETGMITITDIMAYIGTVGQEG